MDRAFRDVLVAWIGDRVAEGATAVIVSHEFDLFAPLAHRAVTVQNGSCHTVDPLSPGPGRLEILEQMARGED
jgi:ABC-type sulfate/molybdate transport systems ATPase subunit